MSEILPLDLMNETNQIIWIIPTHKEFTILWARLNKSHEVDLKEETQ
jgi:hypothetical protein